MLYADREMPRIANTLLMKEYSVNFTVLPWLMTATGSLIMPERRALSARSQAREC
jgi:hypothetical protein